MRDGFVKQEMSLPSTTFLDDVIDSIQQRTFNGFPVDGTDDEAAVLIRRS